jgi:hypothetical protein
MDQGDSSSCGLAHFIFLRLMRGNFLALVACLYTMLLKAKQPTNPSNKLLSMWSISIEITVSDSQT